MKMRNGGATNQHMGHGNARMYSKATRHMSSRERWDPSLRCTNANELDASEVTTLVNFFAMNFFNIETTYFALHEGSTPPTQHV